jgi:hypothetical protein
MRDAKQPILLLTATILFAGLANAVGQDDTHNTEISEEAHPWDTPTSLALYCVERQCFCVFEFGVFSLQVTFDCVASPQNQNLSTSISRTAKKVTTSTGWVNERQQQIIEF